MEEETNTKSYGEFFAFTGVSLLAVVMLSVLFWLRPEKSISAPKINRVRSHTYSNISPSFLRKHNLIEFTPFITLPSDPLPYTDDNGTVWEGECFWKVKEKK